MKFIVGLLVASLAVGGVLCLPAGSPNDEAELVHLPHRQVINRHNSDDSNESPEGGPNFTDFKGVVDTGVGYPFLQPHPLPFSFNLGIFDAFEDIFKRMRDQLWTSSLPSDGDTLSSFDPSKGNTTSTVKIINGHKIEVNETVFGDEDSVFKVRLVNIRPVESEEDVGETTVSDSNAPNPVTSAPNKNSYDNGSDERREPLEKNTDENEIRRNIDEPESLFSCCQSTYWYSTRLCISRIWNCRFTSIKCLMLVVYLLNSSAAGPSSIEHRVSRVLVKYEC